MMQKIFLFLFVGLFGLTILGGCSYTERAYHSDKAVVVEYNQYLIGPCDDIRFSFLKKGTYQISFAIPPQGKGRNDEHLLPKDFSKVVDSLPCRHMIEQSFLPDFLEVTIVYNGDTSSHVYW